MKKLLILIAMLPLLCSAQWTPYGLGLIQKPNAVSARAYLGVTAFTNGSGITFTVLPSGLVQISNSGAGSGTVTSVGLSLPAIFSVSGSPVTTSGTLSASLANQSANRVFAGPTSGGAATPAFRALVADDIPSITLAKISDAGAIAYSNASAYVTSPTNSGSDGQVVSKTGNQTKWITASGGATSIPGIAQRPVYAAQDGTLSAPTWPDTTRYEFDEEFDAFGGTGNGQFGKYYWSGFAAGANSAVANPEATETSAGMLQLTVGPSSSSNFFYLSPYAASTVMPYHNLSTNVNWLFRAVFYLVNTNVTSRFGIGLMDGGFRAKGYVPLTNIIQARVDHLLGDGNVFVFECKSNNTSVTANSTVLANTNTAINFLMYSTNTGVVHFSINGEAEQLITNTPITDMGIFAFCAATNTGGAVNNTMWLDRVSFMWSGMNR